MNGKATIAYFSMEIGLTANLPTYSGGLGILAGDTIRAAADLKIPMAAITLLYRKGFFNQKLDTSGWQTEEPVVWSVGGILEEMPYRTTVAIEGRIVQLRCWRYQVRGERGFVVPVYFLDADLPENSEWDRTLTDFLYGGDLQYRLCQEVILGIGGIRMLRSMGHDQIAQYHMNEGHAAFLTLALLDEEARKNGRQSFIQDDIEPVRSKCVFTTHTLVPAGHDQFPMELVYRIFGHRKEFVNMKDVYAVELASRVISHQQSFLDIEDLFLPGNVLNMVYLALNLNHYVNGVAKKHAEVSRVHFSGYSIDSITNGVHAVTWISEPFGLLYDRYIQGWRQDHFSLRNALGIPKSDIWEAHMRTKERMIDYVNQKTSAGMEVDLFTIGFARRATPYKRGDLLFHDVERLKRISLNAGPLQILYAGKAHPRDEGGKEIIKRIFHIKEVLKKEIKIVYLENYDMELAKLMVSGVDLWLNTPQQPMEASGTSGMKAAMNGVPSLSVLDGWWIEGHIEGVTGWAIGDSIKENGGGGEWAKDAASLYHQLENIIMPMFYKDRNRFIEVMIHSIALNGSFFNTQRMIQEYVLNAYFS